jgi:GNAT superfamily N-acetyltransferase
MIPTIRFATPRDAETIFRFIHGLAEFEHEPEAVDATPALLRAQMEDRNPPFECLIAECEGEAAGFALFFRNYSTWSGYPGLYLEDLFVLEQYRGCGIGKALLRRLAQITTERGWARMEWSVLDWNTSAQDFYRSQGARPIVGEWTVWRLSDEALVKAARQ